MAVGTGEQVLLAVLQQPGAQTLCVQKPSGKWTPAAPQTTKWGLLGSWLQI
jgi:hypothetical protein